MPDQDHQTGPQDIASPLIVVTGEVADDELVALLRAVYVDGGFTDASLAEKIFVPAAIRARGTMIVARDPVSAALLGIIILAPPGAAVRQIADDSEAEMHLLAVSPHARQQGVGRRLVAALVDRARDNGWEAIVLSTQTSMLAAQRLYIRAGFQRLPARDWSRGTRDFLAFGLSSSR